MITDRILFLDGLPNYQRLFAMRIGQTLPRAVRVRPAIEVDVVKRLSPGIMYCEEVGDNTSRLFEEILADEETTSTTSRRNSVLLEKLGEPLYAAQCVSRPPT